MEFTSAQQSCIDALAIFAQGAHHLPKVKPFGSGVEINWHQDLSTYDGAALTRLILVAHRFAIRIGIQFSGPGMVKITAFQRQHGDRKTLKFHEYHPDLADLQDLAQQWKPEVTIASAQPSPEPTPA